MNRKKRYANGLEQFLLIKGQQSRWIDIIIFRELKPTKWFCQKILKKFGMGNIDLSTELETMIEIEKLIENNNLKDKLQKNERINPEEFLNDSQTDEIDQNDMRSMYLTEPVNFNSKISKINKSNLVNELSKEINIANHTENVEHDVCFHLIF